MVKSLSESNSDTYIYDEMRELFLSYFGTLPVSIEKLSADGSPRQYFRLSAPDNISVIAAFSQNIEENLRFVHLGKLFRKHDAKVPKIYTVSNDSSIYLQQDLGDVSLYDCLKDDNCSKYARSAIDSLVKIQSIPVSNFDKASGLNERQIHWDLNYFKYEFLKPADVLFDENRLEDDFDLMCRHIMSIPDVFRGFMYRDFQSRNIMVKDDESWLIDFQGGGYGPLLYDMVSFLWQARADFSDEFRFDMLNYYIEQLSRVQGKEMKQILIDLPVMRLFRMLQVLGAYGFRGLVEKKAKFVEPIPAALSSLEKLLNEGAANHYPELKRVCEVLCRMPRFKKNEKGGSLTVRVFSFSYKKGYPEDLSGNGGGFMFDCRGMHNPGRYKEYKLLTGLDAPVIKFLEDRGEVHEYVGNCLKLVSPSVKKYLERGFTSLQIGFGCTGGKHRSVYCAQKTAEMLKQQFPAANVIIEHREQDIKHNVR